MTYTAKPLSFCDPTKLTGRGGTPVLALDTYEHSYQLHYGASAERYVDAFMENIDWAHVARLHQAHPSSEPESEFEAWRASR